MFGRSRRGASLLQLMTVIAALALVLFVFTGGACNTVNSTVNRYSVEGTVVATPGSKMRMGEGTDTETKFGVNLDTAEGPRIVNCTSTQCSSLVQGNVVRFSCYEEFHVWEPNEEECRFDKLLAAAPPQ